MNISIQIPGALTYMYIHTTYYIHTYMYIQTYTYTYIVGWGGDYTEPIHHTYCYTLLLTVRVLPGAHKKTTVRSAQLPCNWLKQLKPLVLLFLDDLRGHAHRMCRANSTTISMDSTPVYNLLKTAVRRQIQNREAVYYKYDVLSKVV